MENQSLSICAIVITFNRANLLLKCLDSIKCQTLLPKEIIIVDNHSNDGTRDLLNQNGFIDNSPISNNEFGECYSKEYLNNNRSIKITYLYKKINDGGAGGFYAGMKLAYEMGYEWIWMMDDDGKPKATELEELYKAAIKNNLYYINALVVNEKNPTELAFDLSVKLGRCVDNYLDREVYYDSINPFNGTFINKNVIEKIGFIKKELFIWGDETEYTMRAKFNGFVIGTVCSAIHFHPAKHPEFYNVIPFVKWKKCAFHKPIYYRNYGYINWKYRKSSFFKSLLLYTIAFGLRFQFKKLYNFYKYTLRGVNEDWTPISMIR